MSPPLISARDVGFAHPPPTGEVFRSISFDVFPKEVVTLIGASGCGKSTLLRILADLKSPNAGKVARAPECLPSGAVGMVFQHPTLLPWRTVAQNVALPLILSGESAHRDNILQAIQAVGLADSIEKYPHELSGGMQMRVALARALITTPQLLLMDEPFAALDEVTRHKLNEDLLILKDTFGFGIVFVTHSSAEAAFLSDRVMFMAGTPARICEEILVNLPKQRDFTVRQSSGYQREWAHIAAKSRELSA